MHRCINLAPPVQPVQLGLLHLAPFSSNQMHRWYGTGVSEANRLDRCLVTGPTGATDFYRIRPYFHFFEFFLRVLLYLAFLLHLWDL